MADAAASRNRHAATPALSSWNKRLIFTDGFYGPGEYETGEEGSPLIALRTLLEHSYFDGTSDERGGRGARR
jgi:hypothetical protein